MLTLTLSTTLEPFANVSLVFPAAVGVTLPADGLSRDSPLLRLSTDAVAGPVVEPVPVERSPPMGARPLPFVLIGHAASFTPY